MSLFIFSFLINLKLLKILLRRHRHRQISSAKENKGEKYFIVCCQVETRCCLHRDDESK
jgi:hypothetical protein